ncbi:unnamed protein product [Rotaria socialis]|uniref:F-box domain-containing protein n=1 Tax=Rotaria socialis TaxID=392032 RepID=A0A820FVR0_9BILA|nr:unnamed protein product [Rotaria socialis]CAF4270158.1 unnamed protein product [Rotaria socialis]
MPNEVILCIWDQLSSADVIYSFLNLNTRMNSLLLEFHGLYQQLDLRYCSLSACRFLCRQAPTMFEWRLGLTVLKLGSPVRCSQMDLFVDEVAKSVVANHYERQGKSADKISKDICLILIAYKHIQPIFPQLVSLHIFLTTSANEDTINTLLLAIAGGSAMRTFALSSCANQTHHSRAFFDWLFRCSVNLIQYKLQSSIAEDGFEIMYEHTIVNTYVPHYSLVHLKINILNLNTLYVLLHYLPELEHLDANISGIIGQINTLDQNLITKFNCPKKIRVLILRNLKIVGPNCSYLEQLVDKFNNTLQEFSLFLTHYCNGELDICFDGHRLAALCSRLSHLRSLHFAIQLQFIESPSRQILYDFIEAFRTPFWLDGPLGRIRVCVNYHQVFDYVQIFSLPYTFFDNTVYRTIDLIDALFNTSEKGQEISNDLSITLRSFWCGIRCLFISLVEKQKIPVSFLYALQCPPSQNKTLVISHARGILPDDIDDHIQLTHFATLQLMCTSDTMTNYDLQQLTGWLRLLPNTKCLFVSTNELNYWITNSRDNEYLDAFLQRLDRLHIECSSIINKHLNEEVMIPLLSFVINKRHLPRLECLRFHECKNISSAWCSIDKWIDFIFTHINEHQLKYLRFSFIENEQLVTDMQTGDETITLTDQPCIVDIHRLVLENRISFWIERKYK